MKQFKFLLHNEYQRITADNTLTRIGDLSRDNLNSLVKSVISEENACIRNGNFQNPSGWTFELKESSFYIQKKSAEEVYVIAHKDAETITVDAAEPVQDRYDLIQGRYSVVEENSTSVDIIDPSTGIISQSSYNIDKTIKLDINVKKGTPGAGVAPSLDVATAATTTGTVDLSSNVDLSTNYNLKIDIDKSGTPVEIDCRGATPSATTIAEIISAINAAGFGTIASNSGGYLKIDSLTTGEDSYINFTPPTANDAITLIMGLTITPNYDYEYQGGIAYFKLGEVRLQGGSANLVAADLRDIDDRGSWTADVNNIIKIEDLYNLFLSQGNTKLSSQALDVGVAVKDPVYYNNTTGKWEKASFTNPPEGMATDIVSNEVVMNGWKNGLSGFIANTWYYMDSSGNLTTNKTLIQIGYAASITEFIVDIKIDIHMEERALSYAYFLGGE